MDAHRDESRTLHITACDLFSAVILNMYITHLTIITWKGIVLTIQFTSHQAFSASLKHNKINKPRICLGIASRSVLNLLT